MSTKTNRTKRAPAPKLRDSLRHPVAITATQATVLKRDSETGALPASTPSNRPAESTTNSRRLIRWAESLGPLLDCGHGVEFLHDELRRENVVAFLEGFDWLRRSDTSVQVKILGTRPPAIAPEHWPEIVDTAREAVRVLLSSPNNLTATFRHGPIRIMING